MFVRALRDPDASAAREWMSAIADGRTHARVPDLVFLEVANSLIKYVRTGTMTVEEADEELGQVLAAPMEVVSAGLIARQALALAAVRRISVYDGAYLALALGTDAVLVTADQALAKEAQRGALLPGEGPPG